MSFDDPILLVHVPSRCCLAACVHSLLFGFQYNATFMYPSSRSSLSHSSYPLVLKASTNDCISIVSVAPSGQKVTPSRYGVPLGGSIQRPSIWYAHAIQLYFGVALLVILKSLSSLRPGNVIIKFFFISSVSLPIACMPPLPSFRGGLLFFCQK